MSPRVAGRTLIAFLLAAGAPLARAELPRAEPPVTRTEVRASEPQPRAARRPVAVIDISNDPQVRDAQVRDVGYKLLDLLAAHAELAPPAVSDGAALVDQPPLDDEVRLIEARRKKEAAEENLAERNFREAAIDAVEGQELLLHVTPRKALALYADLALALGQSRLGEKKDAEAREAFALCYRLDPRRTLDELHYLPEVVQTFEAAKKVNPGVGRIAVRGAGQVWIDGEEVGKAPGEFKASLGRHVVWLTEFLRETGGKEILVTASRPGDATIMDGPLTRPQKVVRFRMALSHAQDATSRASAMKALAEFVNVRDAVLLSKVNGKIVWQTWRDRAPGFSEIRDLGRDNPVEILKQLAPPKPAPEPPILVVRTAAPPRRWHQRRTVQLGVVATLAAALAGGYLWLRYAEPPRMWDANIRFPTTPRMDGQ
jgi:hypothetical protein